MLEFDPDQKEGEELPSTIVAGGAATSL